MRGIEILHEGGTDVGGRFEVKDKIEDKGEVDDEVESSVDDDEVTFKYATPSYIAGLPPESEEQFMEFYCDAVDQSIKEGQRKETCDETLSAMFKAVGYDKNDRKLFVELLANGKSRFLEVGGGLPFNAYAVKFAERFRAIVDLAKHYRAKLKTYGDIVADTILGTSIRTSKEHGLSFVHCFCDGVLV